MLSCFHSPLNKVKLAKFQTRAHPILLTSKCKFIPSFASRFVRGWSDSGLAYRNGIDDRHKLAFPELTRGHEQRRRNATGSASLNLPLVFLRREEEQLATPARVREVRFPPSEALQRQLKEQALPPALERIGLRSWPSQLRILRLSKYNDSRTHIPFFATRERGRHRV